MNRSCWHRILAVLIAFTVTSLWPVSAHACATCFGGDDSQMSRGASMGILFLLVVVVGMLSTVGAFFMYLARRAKETLHHTPAAHSTGSTPSTFE